MGTNFYLVDYRYEDGQYIHCPSCEHCGRNDLIEEETHIGKRSAAGAYCWDCGKTLCRKGENGIHYSVSDWHNRCPVCDKKPSLSPGKTSLTEGAAAVELGFVPPNPGRPTGVGSCCSFLWAQPPADLRVFVLKHRDVEIIRDEYGRKMTGQEFLTMLEMNCPVQYMHSIGKNFC